MHKLSIIVLRLGLGAVVIWFAFAQFSDPTAWVSFLPSWTQNLPVSQIGFIYLNGWFEVTFAILMIVGFYTRISAFLLAVHLLGIVFTLGINATGVRDFGLVVALTAISLYGTSRWSADEYFDRRNHLAQ